MLENIKKFPDQLQYDPQIEGELFEYPYGKVFVAGMGGSGAVADFLVDWLDKEIIPVKGYNLPGFAVGGDLVILISYSGNTEETLSVFEEVLKKGLKCVCISSGGKLMELSLNKGFPFLKVPEGYQPREAYGFLISASVKALKSVGYIDEETYKEFSESCERLKGYISELSDENSETYEIASKIYKRLPFIYSQFQSVAVRWKNQINENANNFAHISIFPEHNHNEIEGFDFPEFIKDKSWMVFLRTDYDHPSVKLRMDIVKEILRDNVVGFSEVWAKGKSKVEQLLYLIWYGDFVSYWLALQNSTDPYRIDRIKTLKNALKDNR